MNQATGMPMSDNGATDEIENGGSDGSARVIDAHGIDGAEPTGSGGHDGGDDEALATRFGADVTDLADVADVTDLADVTEVTDMTVTDVADVTEVADLAVTEAAPGPHQEGADLGSAKDDVSPHGDAADPDLVDDDDPGAEGTVSDDADGSGLGGADAAGKGRRSRLAVLEREGEVAADFLERLLDIADLDGDIDVDIDGDRAAVSVVDSEEGRVPRRLVGPDGRVLEALQELTRLAVQTATGERSRLMLDVAGFRAERRSALVELARTRIDEVRASGEPQTLADMTAFERKVVHDEVTAAGLISESEGIEPHRHIVIRAS